MHKIKSVNEIPKLFDIKKYEPAVHFDPEGWFNNLMIRKTLSEKYISMGIPEEMGEYHAARATLETSMKNIDKLLNSPLQPFPPEFDFNDSIVRNNEVVTSLSKNDAYRFYLNLPVQRQQQIEKLDDDDFFNREADEVLRNDLKLPVHHDHILLNTERSFNIDILGYETYHNMAYARINLEASSDVIIKELKKWVAKEKETYFNNAKDKQFTRPNFLKWCNASVLQYLDLSIWAEIHDVTIPNHIMGEAIYPTNKQVNVAEAVRKTTKPIAEMLMSTGLPILNAQRYIEKYPTKPE